MLLVLKKARLAFPNLFTPRAFGEDGTADFNAIFIFDRESANEAECRKVMDEVGSAKWREKWPAIKKELESRDRTAMHDGANKASLDGFDGNFYVSARNKVRPTCVDRDRSALAESDGKLYSGVFVNAHLDLWAMDNKYGRRICATLTGVQYVEHGDAFGAGPKVAAADTFEVLSDDDMDDLV